MTPEIATVLAILLVAVVLFITEWVRMDVVALIVLGSLALTGLVSPSEALSGFSSPAVVTVWAVLILSAGLARTGVAGLIGHRLLRLAGDSEIRLLTIIMLTVGLLSGFMNTIGVASLFLPVVIDIARRTHQPPSKLLMPLAFAALLGGLNTLIGTPPNILISEALLYAGLTPFKMFDYTPVGLTVMLAGIAFMVLVGRRLLPRRDIAREVTANGSADYKSLYELHERMVFLNLPKDSPLNGKTLGESRLGSALGINVVAILRDGQTHLAPDAKFCLRSGDRLLVEGKLEQFFQLANGGQLILEQEQVSVERLISAEVALAEVRFSAGSPLIGHTLRQIGFRHRYQVIVLAIKRGQVALRTNLENIPLLFDDVLLVQGRRHQIEELSEEADLHISPISSLDEYNLAERLMVVRVPLDSNLVGRTLVESRLGDAYGLGIMGIVRQGENILMPTPEERLEGGDTLLVKGKLSDFMMIKGLHSLEVETQMPRSWASWKRRRPGWQKQCSPRTRPWWGKACARSIFAPSTGSACWRSGARGGLTGRICAIWPCASATPSCSTALASACACWAANPITWY